MENQRHRVLYAPATQPRIARNAQKYYNEGMELMIDINQKAQGYRI